MENAVDETPAHRPTLVDPQSAKTSKIANKSVIVGASRPDCSSDFGLETNLTSFRGNIAKKDTSATLLSQHRGRFLFFPPFSGQDDLFYRLITKSEEVSRRARQAA